MDKASVHKPIYFSKYSSRQIESRWQFRSSKTNAIIDTYTFKRRDKRHTIHILGTNGPNKLLNQVMNKDYIR